MCSGVVDVYQDLVYYLFQLICWVIVYIEINAKNVMPVKAECQEIYYFDNNSKFRHPLT